MRNKLFTAIIGCMIAGALFSTSVWAAGQVVTDDIKAWAKEAVSREKALAPAKAPANSVAVLYFTNKTKQTDLDLLEKGLTIMLMSDLHKVETIQLVERVKLNAIMDELTLSSSGLIDSASSSRVGQLLGARHLVGGDIVTGKPQMFQFQSSLVHVPDEKVFGKPEAEGLLIDELLRMEKDLLFDIIRLLEIQLTEEEELALKEPLSTNKKALIYLFQAVNYSDNGDYVKANEYYEKALAEDPNLEMAQAGIGELKTLGLLAAVPPSKTDPEGYSESGGETDPYDDLNNRYKNFDRPNDKDKGDPDPITKDGSMQVNWVIQPNEFDLYGHIQANVTDGLLADLSGIEDKIRNTTEDMNALEAGKYVSGTFNPDGTWTGDQPDDVNYSFWSDDGYTYGLQAVGRINPPALFVGDEALAAVSSDGYLAYAVQVEEDRLNQKILEMHREAIADQEALSAIDTALGHASLRIRDAYLTQKADAQAGRVLKDKSGNWTRIQQYMLRPDNQTVQMLNACLRGTGPHAGVSAMNWTTKFNEAYDGSLRDLPWNDWLNVHDGDGKYINYDYYTPVSLANMSVEFTNPGGESLREEVHFDTGSGFQMVSSEKLTISGSETKTYENTYFGSYLYEYGTVQESPQFETDDPEGFVYRSADGNDIVKVDFFVVGDIDEVDNNYGNEIETGFKDIWSALRVNETGYYGSDAYTIGRNNLEIEIDRAGAFFAKPIDVVYIPMSRMLWKTEESRLQ